MREYNVFVSYAEPDRAWVEGYLLDALHQAGVRYYSEAAFALGVPRLLGFEHAIQQSQRTVLVLSPAYLANGFAQFPDLLAQSYGLETATWPVIPLILHSVQLPSRLSMLTALDATDAADWPRVIERLCEELQCPVPGPAPKPLCPYPGMVPFHETDSHRFFGRDQEVRELLECLRLHPFLTVIGPSGSGKSSLVFAGLIPALRKSGLFGPGEWLVRMLRLGEAPLTALATVFGGDLANVDRAVSDVLATQPNARRLLLVIDQFEEVFTVARTDVGLFQQAVLRLAETPSCSLVLTVRADFYADLMATPLWRRMQAHRFEVLPLDGQGLRAAIVRPAEAEDVGVCVEPALVERLVADAAEEPGILPLVQETLVLVWERLQRRFLPLSAYATLGDRHRTGLQVAMARRADATLADLTRKQQTIARRIFLRLVQFGEGRADTRRQQPAALLRSAGDEPRLFDQTLAHLTNNRLLTLSGEAEEAGKHVDMAHEALIAGWPTLQDWLKARREAEQTRRRLEDKAREWGRLGLGSGGLLDEVELLEAERWLASLDAADLGRSEALSALVRISRETIEEAERQKETARQRELTQAQALAAEQQRVAEEQRQRAEEQARATKRLRRRAVVLAVVALLAVGAAVYAIKQEQRAQKNEQLAAARAAEAVTAQARAEVERDRAEQQTRLATSRHLAAQAIAYIDKQFDLALLLSLEANRLTDTDEVRDSLGTVLEAASPYLITFLRGHALAVEGVAFNPARHSNMLASVGNNGTVLLWDSGTRQFLESLDIGNRFVLSIAFSPDGRILALGTADGTILLWDIATHHLLGAPLIGRKVPVGSVAFSPDGTLVASGHTETSGHGDSVVMLWDVASRQPRCPPLTGHQRDVTRVVFSPDGTLIASGSRDNGRIMLWDVAQCRQRGPHLHGHDGTTIAGLAFSPDSTLVASSGKDDAIILWDVTTGQPRGQPLRGHTNWVFSVAFSPDGATLASGSWDNTLMLWDVTTGQPLGPPLHGHSAPVLSVAFSPDGATLASGGRDTAIILWHVTAPNVLTIPSARVGRPVPWEVATWQPYGRSLTDYAGFVTSVAFSPDGQTLAAGTGDHTVMLWDVATRQPLDPPFTGHATTVWAVAFSPDGRTVASGSADGMIFLWEVATLQPLFPLTRHTGLVRNVAFSPDGQTVASSSRDGSFILWDVVTRQPRCQVLSRDGVTGIAFSPDGRVIATGSDRGPITVWDATNCERLDPPLDAHKAFIRSVVFSPDGQMLISSSDDQTIRLWDVATRQQLEPSLTGHTNWVFSLALSPDGRLLASSSHDNRVMLWDMVSRQLLGTKSLCRLRDWRHSSWHSSWVRSIVFSPDGRMVASGGGDGTIILWDIDFASWQARACRTANRNLTPTEWKQFIGDESYRKTCPELP